MTRQRWIAVGVDGSDGSRAAAQWAAQEARRVGAGVRLVHIFDDHVPMAGLYAAVYPAGSVEGHVLAARTVRRASHAVQRILDDERIEQVVLRGDRRAGLLRAAADADLMVLGDVAHPAHHRLITGSIVGPIATHSPVPVAVVPAGWLPDPARTAVVVGVKCCDASRGLVRHAMQIAADRQAGLVVLHAWEHAPATGDLIEDYDKLPDWEKRSRADLAHLIDEASTGLSGVDVEVRLIHGQPARVLTDASATAQLLVIARRPRGFPFGHLGGTGRAVLRESRCPAMVLPPYAEATVLPTTAVTP